MLRVLSHSAAFCRIMPKLRISASYRPIDVYVVFCISNVHTHTYNDMHHDLINLENIDVEFNI